MVSAVRTSMLYGFFRAIEKPGMSVMLTVVSLGLRVILAYGLSAVRFIGVTGIWVFHPDRMADRGYYRRDPDVEVLPECLWKDRIKGGNVIWP